MDNKMLNDQYLKKDKQVDSDLLSEVLLIRDNLADGKTRRRGIGRRI